MDALHHDGQQIDAWHNSGWDAIEVGRTEQMRQSLDAIAYNTSRPYASAPSDFEAGRRRGRWELSTHERKSNAFTTIIFVGPFIALLWSAIVLTLFSGWGSPLAIMIVFPILTVITLSLMYIFWPSPPAGT